MFGKAVQANCSHLSKNSYKNIILEILSLPDGEQCFHGSLITELQDEEYDFWLRALDNERRTKIAPGNRDLYASIFILLHAIHKISDLFLVST